MSLFDIAGKEAKLKELEEQTNSQDFWNDQENTTKVLQEIKFFASDEIIDSWSKYNTTYLNEPELKKDNRILHIVEICLILF